jgi:hypothetical protein
MRITKSRAMACLALAGLQRTCPGPELANRSDRAISCRTFHAPRSPFPPSPPFRVGLSRIGPGCPANSFPNSPALKSFQRMSISK